MDILLQEEDDPENLVFVIKKKKKGWGKLNLPKTCMYTLIRIFLLAVEQVAMYKWVCSHLHGLSLARLPHMLDKNAHSHPHWGLSLTWRITTCLSAFSTGTQQMISLCVCLCVCLTVCRWWTNCRSDWHSSKSTSAQIHTHSLPLWP